jgi:hypothetical protein
MNQKTKDLVKARLSLIRSKTLTAWHKGLRGRVMPALCGNAANISGDVSDIYGDASNIRGDVSYLRGDVSGIRGDVSGIAGDVSGIKGDAEEILEILKGKKP